VTGRWKDLCVQADPFQEVAASFWIHNKVVSHAEWHIPALRFRDSLQGFDERNLRFRDDQPGSLLFHLLDQPRVVGVKVGHKDVSDLFHNNPVALQHAAERTDGAGPPAIKEKPSSDRRLNEIVVGRAVTDVDDAHAHG